MWYASNCRGMQVMIGMSIGSVFGTLIMWSAISSSGWQSSVVTAMTRPPRALISRTLLMTLSKRESFGATTTTGMFSSITFGVDVADFLELEGTFHGDRVVEVAAQVQEVSGGRVLLRDFGDAVGKLQGVLDKFGQLHHCLRDIRSVLDGKPALATEEEGNHG